jgi:hypothetical protein
MDWKAFLLSVIIEVGSGKQPWILSKRTERHTQDHRDKKIQNYGGVE